MTLLQTGRHSDTASTEWSVWTTRCRLVVTDPAVLPDARRLLEDQLTAVDRVVNPARPGSELRRLRTDGQPVAVGPLLAELLGSRLAPPCPAGADPYPYAMVPGADGGPVHQPAPAPRQAALEEAALRTRSGLQLELAATARAWTAQRCAETIAEATGGGVLVSLGSDVATSGLAPTGGWRIELRDLPTGPATVIAVDGGALSGISTVRSGRPGGTATLYPVVAPVTGRVLEAAWRSITVAAAHGVEANAVCAAALARGADAPGWLAALGLPARLVEPAGTVRTVGGWPAAH